MILARSDKTFGIGAMRAYFFTIGVLVAAYSSAKMGKTNKLIRCLKYNVKTVIIFELFD